jgi:nucleotide-binding universal stress UspA family protein
MGMARFLVPVDFSEGSWIALKQATSLAEHFDATIDVLHVWIAPPYVDNIHQVTVDGAAQRFDQFALGQAGVELNRLMSSVAPEIARQMTTRIVAGDPYLRILEMSDAYDLIVMGTHGRTGVAHLLLGSVAEKVVRRAHCPVLTSRQPRKKERDGNRQSGAYVHGLLDRGGKILVATDFSASSLAALRLASTIAERLDGAIHVLHVVEPPSYVGPHEMVVMGASKGSMSELLRQQGQVDLDRLLDDFASTQVPVNGLIRQGNAREEVLDEANEGCYDLVILGTHGRTGWSRLWMGSLAEQVVRRATCPVLTVRERERVIDNDA